MKNRNWQRSRFHITVEEIDGVLDEAKGNVRQAIRTLLHDPASFASEADRLVSDGFARGRAPWSRAEQPIAASHGTVKFP